MQGISSVETQVQTASEKEMIVEQHALGILIHTLEKHKNYPKAAQRSGTEGIVPLLFTINTQGVVTAFSIEKNDASAILLRAAKVLGEKIISLNIKINMTTAKTFQVIVPIAYQLSRY